MLESICSAQRIRTCIYTHGPTRRVMTIQVHRSTLMKLASSHQPLESHLDMRVQYGVSFWFGDACYFPRAMAVERN